jgi:hypothetical protein
MTSFTVQYNLDKRSRQILPDGKEEYPDDAGQWALFQQAEEVSSNTLIIEKILLDSIEN